LATSPSVPILA